MHLVNICVVTLGIYVSLSKKKVIINFLIFFENYIFFGGQKKKNFNNIFFTNLEVIRDNRDYAPVSSSQ